MLSPANVKRMLSAGLQPVSYRLRTELAVDAWHWNPKGRWSDPARHEGYWVSDARSEKPILLSYGYHLPRRGDTLDEANNDGYSRLDDGDFSTFWKSNPYLDACFTGEDNRLHPQWVVIDFGSPVPIDAIAILGEHPMPPALKSNSPQTQRPLFIVKQSRECGERLIMDESLPGGVATRSSGLLTNLFSTILRIWMTQGFRDGRQRVGGYSRPARLRNPGSGSRHVKQPMPAHDIIRHKAASTQTLMYVSSTDPWHRERDRDDNVERPGFDMLAKSGLTRGLPLLAPVAVVYDTPENAASEVSFLKSRGYNVRIEMGEEPDGQKIDPANYAALYVRWADAIHRVAPEEQFGGPSFVSLDFDRHSDGWKYGSGWWIKRFMRYLREHHHSGDLTSIFLVTHSMKSGKPRRQIW